METLRTQLKEKVTDLVMELMDNYDTAPEFTYEALVDEFPEFSRNFTQDEIISVCEDIQRSEIPEEAARLQPIFENFNERYFDGELRGYTIRAVYDINY